MPTQDPRVMMQDPRIALGQASVQLQRMGQDNMRLASENDGLKMRLQHFTAALIGTIRTHFKDNEFRIPKSSTEKIDAGTAINTRLDPTSDEIVIEILTQKEFQLRMAGLEIGMFEATVPRKAPYKVSVKIPDGAKFEGPELVAYRGGRSAGKELLFVPGKPKKIREYTADKDAVFTFTTDSAGMDVTIQFLIRREVKQEELEEPAEKALEYRNEACREWHETENDGNKIVGRFCPECGDSRKVIAAKV